MKTQRMRKLCFAVLASVAIFGTGSAGVFGASLSDATVEPGEATANSVYKFSVVWRDPEDGLLPQSVLLTVEGAQYTVPPGTYEGWDIKGAGITYSVKLTAGLDMKTVDPFPPDPNVRYCSQLTADSAAGKEGEPKSYSFRWDAVYQGVGDPPPDPVDVEASGSGPTVHDSFISEDPLVDRYGGIEDYNDWMISYPYQWPTNDFFKDPLHVEPYADGPDDEGTSTSSYIFRVHYVNEDDLPPKPWVRCEDDPWNTSWLDQQEEDWNESGVMLYLRNMDEPGSVFEGHHMYKENPEDATYKDEGSDPGCVYILRVVPTGGLIRVPPTGHWRTTWANTRRTNHYYESLTPGRYQYFFACSDDDFSQLDKDDVWPSLEDNPVSPVDSGEYLFGAIGLNFDTGYVCKSTYMPGWWMTGYVHDSWVGPSWGPFYPHITFPQVDPGLFEVEEGFVVEGGARFLGTLSPYMRAVNPWVPNQAGSSGMWRHWSETAGGTTGTMFKFRVYYRHSKGVAPASVQVHINNWGTEWNGETMAGPYVDYDMEPVFDGTPTEDDYKAGVLYQYEGTLPAGPHSYYFEAIDPTWWDADLGIWVGGRHCRYPRRPDTLSYDGVTFYDGKLPQGIDPNAPGGDPTLENDFINGPYVNTKPVLTDSGVTPAFGPTGTDFVFRVTYTDADNQRPFFPFVLIEAEDGGTLENGGLIPCTMVKEDPTDGDYTDGCVYVLHASSMPGLRLQPGTRRYYFEFTDDWGRQTDPNDRIFGETVWLPDNQWLYGPQVTTNDAPTLSDGTVTSADGTSNDATVWNYKVTYTDPDDQPPAYIVVYLGMVDSGSGLIIWDAGHPMEPLNPDDAVYSDGRVYYYATRLPGDSDNPIKYYYCFVASDGVDRAQYDPTASPSSGTIWSPAETLTPVDGSTTDFGFAHAPVVNDVPPSPLNPSYYSGPLIYEDGTLLIEGLEYTINAEDGLVVLALPTSGTITAQYFFGTEGPSAVTGNTAPTLESGKVAPGWGSSSDLFKFSVTYKDVDGPNGQPPDYVNVVIDGIQRAMLPAWSGGVYKLGVPYELETTLSSGTHSFYFETSDGVGLGFFDAEGSKSSNEPIPDIVPIEGPYVNDRPTLTMGSIVPNPGGGISTSQPVTYSVTYTDADNDVPDAGYPVVYVDNLDETDYDGTVTAVTDNTITDSTQSWTADEFSGVPVQITSGPWMGTVYTVDSNTEDTLILLATEVDSNVSVGDTFSIAKLVMLKQDPFDQIYADGMVYEARVPSLGKGNHSAHFKALVTETIVPGEPTVTIVRYPLIGELLGPYVEQESPPGNVPPTLSDYSVTPGSGTTSTTFTFGVTYTDANGDPPELHDNVLGYIRLVLDEEVYDMQTPAVPNYTLGAICTYAKGGLPPGVHEFHFEASDGWASTRLPLSPSEEYTLNVNRAPVLSDPSVTPLSGNVGTVYEYKVTYSDADGQPPTSLKVVIDGAETEIATPKPGADYTLGVEYSYSLPGGSLAVGAHEYYFVANDGLEEVSTDVQNGPYVHDNNPPDLGGGSVNPTSGWADLTYVYSVTYSDPDGDQPEYVKVYIDGDAEANSHLMVKDPNEDDFATHVTYTHVQDGLAAGSHTFWFKASDYMAEARDPDSGSYPGPSTSERPTAAITITCTPSPEVGEAAVVSGQISPPMSVTLTLTFEKPDATTVTSTVATQANGSYVTTWTPDMVGSWKLKASWAGGNNYLPTESDELTVVVLGESKKVTGLDMISIPLVPTNRFPEAVFGSEQPFAVARYRPSARRYAYYYSIPVPMPPDIPLFEIREGRGYWIKVLSDEPKDIAPSGGLVSTSTNFAVGLSVGWNQVGCPFTEELDWGDLEVRYNSERVGLATAASRQWIREYGWAYDPSSGNYKLVDASRSGAERKMRPWRGYWMKALVNCDLLIPPPTGSKSPRPEIQSMQLQTEDSGDAPGWEVRLAARLGSLVDGENVFGMAPSDVRIESPACFDEFVDLYFTDEENGLYAYDLRSSVSAGDSWIFRVLTDQADGLIELTWSGLESMPAGTVLTLTDEGGEFSAVLRPGECYSFPASEAVGGRQFRIVVSAK